MRREAWPRIVRSEPASKDRERNALRWDDQLTLELNGKSPGVKSIQVTPNPSAVTVFIAGDSTVTDQFDDGGKKGSIQNGWAWYTGI